MESAAEVVGIEGLVCRAGDRAGARLTLAVHGLRIVQGERVAVIGPNGAGKTTLLRVLGGFVAPVAGRVDVLGQPMWPRPRRAALRALRAQVGQLAQGLHLVPRLSARDNVLVGALARWPGWRGWLRLPPPALVDEADAALAAVGLSERADVRADRLSGGERQKVALARLRLQRPRLVLADEPTAALDPAAVSLACDALRQAAAGATLVTVVHQTALLPALAQRVIGLRGGRVWFDRPLADVDARLLDRLYAPTASATAAAPGAQADGVARACWVAGPRPRGTAVGAEVVGEGSAR